MTTRRVLLAHDGSAAADATIADLARAGLGDDVDCEVLCVGSVLPAAVAAGMGPWLPTAEDLRLIDESALAEARATAEAAAGRVRRALATWRVAPAACTGPPAWQIVRRAEESGAGLVALGARGRSGLAKWLLGSVADAVARHARCSVRVSRSHPGPPSAPRVLLASDGSHDAQAAVRAVAARDWPAGTLVRVVTVVDHALRARLDSRTADAALEWARASSDAAARSLASSRVSASHEVRQGDARVEILQAADTWKADAIVLGARGLSGVERVVLGSVSSAVLAHAPCTVEIARP